MSRERIPADVRKLAKELAQAEADAPRLGVRTVHEVWSKRVSLPARPAGASRPVLQRHAGRRREDAGYASGIATTFEIPQSMVQKQLKKFEDGNVLTSRPVGNARVFTWNSRNPTVAPLRALFASSFKYVPQDEIVRYYRERRRPRRANKPL